MREAEELLKILEGARDVFVLTGAGVSTPSGIPDFRGKGGLYERISPEVFCIEKFKQDPSFFYRQIGPMLKIILEAEPNPAHYLIAELERRGKVKLVATQNIDGLHQKAGSRKVVELHGSLEIAHCLSCGRSFSKEDYLQEALRGRVPRCSCGGVIKPDVVFFGEPLPSRALYEAIKAASSADLCLVMGSSLMVYPASSLPEYTLAHGGKLVIINLGETYLDPLAHRKFDVPVEKISREALRLLGAN